LPLVYIIDRLSFIVKRASFRASVRCPAARRALANQTDEVPMADRQLRVGAFMRPVGIHAGWWRYPGAYPMRISTSST
jgi:hypothetical protein